MLIAVVILLLLFVILNIFIVSWMLGYHYHKDTWGECGRYKQWCSKQETEELKKKFAEVVKLSKIMSENYEKVITELGREGMRGGLLRAATLIEEAVREGHVLSGVVIRQLKQEAEMGDK